MENSQTIPIIEQDKLVNSYFGDTVDYFRASVDDELKNENIEYFLKNEIEVRILDYRKVGEERLSFFYKKFISDLGEEYIFSDFDYDLTTQILEGSIKNYLKIGTQSLKIMPSKLTYNLYTHLKNHLSLINYPVKKVISNWGNIIGLSSNYDVYKNKKQEYKNLSLKEKQILAAFSTPCGQAMLKVFPQVKIEKLVEADNNIKVVFDVGEAWITPDT